MAEAKTGAKTIEVVRGSFAEQFGIATILKLAKDTRATVAAEQSDGKVFTDELDVNGALLEVYQGWLRDAGVELLPHDDISPSVLGDGNAEIQPDQVSQEQVAA